MGWKEIGEFLLITQDDRDFPKGQVHQGFHKEFEKHQESFG